MRMLRSNETSIFIWTPNYIQVDYDDYVTSIPSFFILYVGHSYADCQNEIFLRDSSVWSNEF